MESGDFELTGTEKKRGVSNTKRTGAQKSVKKPPTESLTISLYAPGMSLMHRAGLGGLACTLNSMERQHRAGTILEESLPGPIVDGQYPWTIDDRSVTLQFVRPENASEYLRKLFAFAFSITESGLIYLPGQFENRPSDAILAELQQGLILTFLQHGKVRNLAKDSTVMTIEIGEDGVPGLEVSYKKCSFFKHQDGWQSLVDKKANITSGNVSIDGPICPGTVVRHVAFTGPTCAEDPPERMLALYFAMVGCLSLPVNRGVAALIIPEVMDLTEFIYDRPFMSPSTSMDCQIANAADGVLWSQSRFRHDPRRQADIRSRVQGSISGSSIPACSAMTFKPTPWASQQKSRVETILVPADDLRILERYERARAHLPPRIRIRKVQESTGRGKNKVMTERTESFRAESVVRPFVADNLARGRKWYERFVDLMTKVNPANDKPFRDSLKYETGGLHAMISDDTMWDEDGERTVVQAVHEALRSRYAQIAEENKGNSVAMKKRWEGEYDRWRLAFSGSKTPDQFRRALCDMFSRAGRNTVLQTKWQSLLPMMRTTNWQHARDLSLLALCSYQSNRTESDVRYPSTEN